MKVCGGASAGGAGAGGSASGIEPLHVGPQLAVLVPQLPVPAASAARAAAPAPRARIHADERQHERQPDRQPHRHLRRSLSPAKLVRYPRVWGVSMEDGHAGQRGRERGQRAQPSQSAPRACATLRRPEPTCPHARRPCSIVDADEASARVAARRAAAGLPRHARRERGRRAGAADPRRSRHRARRRAPAGHLGVRAAAHPARELPGRRSHHDVGRQPTSRSAVRGGEARRVPLRHQGRPPRRDPRPGRRTRSSGRISAARCCGCRPRSTSPRTASSSPGPARTRAGSSIWCSASRSSRPRSSSSARAARARSCSRA